MDEADLGVTLFDAQPTDGHPNPFETFKKLSLKNGSPSKQDCN